MKGTTSLKYTLMKCAESVRKKGKRVDAIVCCTWTRYLGSTKHPINPTTYVSGSFCLFFFPKIKYREWAKKLKIQVMCQLAWRRSLVCTHEWWVEKYWGSLFRQPRSTARKYMKNRKTSQQSLFSPSFSKIKE